MKKNRSSFSILRWILLLLILGFVTANAYFHQHPEILGKTASVCALCPTGAIESFLYWIRTGYFIHRIALSSLILLLSILVTSFLFRRSFCGQFCPLGTLQELFSSMGNQIKSIGVLRKKTKKDSFRWTKYIVIAAFIAVPWFTSSLFFRSIDPWVAYAHITTLEIFGLFLWGFLILLFSLLGSFIWDRFFCKYLCPFGAFLGLLSPIGMYGIHRNTETCIDCKKCDHACPANIVVSQVEFVTDTECIMCNECINACPVENTLEIATKKRTLTSTPMKVTAISIIFMLLVAGAFTMTGHFKWFFPNTSTPYENQVLKNDVDDIRGFMTLRELSIGYGVPLEILMEEFASSPDDADTPIKDLVAEGEGHGTDFVREFIRNYRP